MTSSDLTYRKTAIEGETGLGLLIALFDTLAGDLRRAAQAERHGDIGRRCRETNHALLLIAHLEECVSQSEGGELSRKLAAFYSGLKRQIINAQAKRSAVLLEDLMNDVLAVRAHWHQANAAATPRPEYVPAGSAQDSPYGGAASAGYSQVSWSA
jgi:flagellar protein FliS